MIRPLPTRKLPQHPDLDQLKRQAKELLDDFRAGKPEALIEVERFFGMAGDTKVSLQTAQLVLARCYGFDSWPKLKAYVDGINVERLGKAVQANDVEQVRAILKIRPELVNMTAAWNNSHTALHYAVLGRMPEMVRVLMQHGADARAGISPHNEATTPLVIATEREYDEIAAILREEENRRDAGRAEAVDAASQLRQALRSGDEQEVIALLERNPEYVAFRNPRDGRTLLHFASGLLLETLAQWLLDRGADPAEKAGDGRSPLDVVGCHCDEEERAAGTERMIRLLLARGAIQTAQAAVILGDGEFLRARHAEGLFADPLDEDGGLLRVAVDHNRPDMLQLLLDLGLDPDAKIRVEPEGIEEIAFSWGMPLYECARHSKHAMAEILLARGADPNAQVYASGTPLSEAYGQRDDAMVALLEKYGGESNPSMAGLYRRKDLALRLLAKYGDEKLPDDGFSSGTVAEQLIGAAARGGDPEVMRLGMERVHWPDGDPRWYSALNLGFWNHWIGPWCHPEWDRTTYLQCFRMGLQRLGPPNHQHRFGMTVLHQIVTMGDHVRPEERVAFAEAALDAGARLDLRDDLLKSTPLGWACRWGRDELVRVFLERGADPIEAGAEPWARPAAWAGKKGHKTISELLRSRQMHSET